MTETNLNTKEAIEKLSKLVGDVKVCMFATIAADYSFFSRPMYTAQVDESGNIWFFTNEYSEKVEDISYENTVYLIYSHPGENTYVHVKGKCEVINNKQKLDELWNPALKAWFPGGKEDPKICFLKVNTEEAAYWDGSSNKLVTFYNIVKSAATGTGFNNGEYGKLDLDQA